MLGKISSKLPPTWGAALALSAFSGWLAALFWGAFFGGAAHLLLVFAAMLFPWRSIAPSEPA